MAARWMQAKLAKMRKDRVRWRQSGQGPVRRSFLRDYYSSVQFHQANLLDGVDLKLIPRKEIRGEFKGALVHGQAWNSVRIAHEDNVHARLYFEGTQFVIVTLVKSERRAYRSIVYNDRLRALSAWKRGTVTYIETETYGGKDG